MGLFEKLRNMGEKGMRRKKSKEQAKERLIMVLEYEREGLPPAILDELKEDFVQVFRKYRYFDERQIMVEAGVSADGKGILRIEIPIVRR